MAKYRVEISGVDTSKIKVLSNDEMTELFKKYAAGDPFAREDLIKGNLKLVLSILKGYANRCDNMDDLFQVGTVGLVKAVDNFDLTQEVKFSTYAVPMIMGEIKRYIRDNTGIRVTRSLKDIAYKAMKAKEELTNSLNREPLLEEIAEYVDIPAFSIVNAFEAIKDPMSMQEPIFNDGGDTIYLEEQVKDDSNKVGEDMRIMLNDAINSLKDKEKLIIYKRYFEGITQLELSETIGISQAQISRIEKNGLESIKKLIR